MTQLDTLLQNEKRRLDDEKQDLVGQIATAKKRLTEVQLRLRHVEGLLGMSEESDRVPRVTTKSDGLSLLDIAEEVLTERGGEPMYYKDLAQEVQTRGGELSGENAANILVARLVSDNRFVRPVKKGYYALRRDYPDAKNVGARTRRRGSR